MIGVVKAITAINCKMTNLIAHLTSGTIVGAIMLSGCEATVTIGGTTSGIATTTSPRSSTMSVRMVGIMRMKTSKIGIELSTREKSLSLVVDVGLIVEKVAIKLGNRNGVWSGGEGGNKGIIVCTQTS